MRPISYTIKDGVTTFHYDPIELAEFHRLGKQDGNVGMILIEREGINKVYKGYGTIENPIRYELQMTLRHLDDFDGRMLTDDERINPPKSNGFKETYRMVIINTSEYNNEYKPTPVIWGNKGGLMHREKPTYFSFPGLDPKPFTLVFNNKHFGKGDLIGSLNEDLWEQDVDKNEAKKL